MVTINTGEPLTIARPYIASIAILGMNFAARLEGLSVIINDELVRRTITLHINSEIYAARSHVCFVDEFFESASCVDDVTGLPTDLTVNVRIGIPPRERDFAVIVTYSGSVETATLLKLPTMPESYWRDLVPDET